MQFKMYHAQYNYSRSGNKGQKISDILIESLLDNVWANRWLHPCTCRQGAEECLSEFIFVV